MPVRPIRKVVSRTSRHATRKTPYLEILECGHQLVTMYKPSENRYCDRCQEDAIAQEKLARIPERIREDMTLQEIREVLCDL